MRSTCASRVDLCIVYAAPGEETSRIFYKRLPPPPPPRRWWARCGEGGSVRLAGGRSDFLSYLWVATGIRLCRILSDPAATESAATGIKPAGHTLMLQECLKEEAVHVSRTATTTGLIFSAQQLQYCRPPRYYASEILCLHSARTSSRILLLVSAEYCADIQRETCHKTDAILLVRAGL